MNIFSTEAIGRSRQSIGLEIINLSKKFGNFTALDNVSLKVKPGSFHALLGENGAGKSTLVKCVMGFHPPSEGSILVNDKEYDIANPQAAHMLGLGMVYQHFTLVPHMTVLENLVLSQPDLPNFINWSLEREKLATFIQKMPFQIQLDTKAQDLSAGEKQKVEILKQLYLGSGFLILDEPTSVLTPGEADEVLGLIRDMTAEEGLTVLMITHKFREVLAFADEVSVLRRGVYAGGGKTSDLTTDDMAQMMVGSDISAKNTTRKTNLQSDVRLAADKISAMDDTGHTVVRDLSFKVKSGEILGIAGVSGNGQKELVEVLAGQRSPISGAMQMHGENYLATRQEMRRHKVYCLPEEPLKNACVANMSVSDNLAFRTFDQSPLAKGSWWLNKLAFRLQAKDLIAKYNVKTSSPDVPIGTLSGGNVQRTVLARELSGDVDVLIVANPVFGLDFAAVADIHAQIMEARNRGVAILLVSEDLDEILELSDRIAVMFHGELVYETPADEADLTVIGRHMAGN
ncbi:ATP-binding cassette domain-containing protein [Sneathiella sp. P13V-1]|uniref:ABC transporter ATP-binding protein n=1 Tax=Sneathiella sp. P13V-1 TaxID=2697366 RepID=UPI00187B95A9|nr:ABC transporter ATP-binding protein [Sneathiella sp. P13V-1]MBE7635269.1 ATP-binding cassette domain-containing protein [Sneathiella sp. P13V-1]